MSASRRVGTPVARDPNDPKQTFLPGNHWHAADRASKGETRDRDNEFYYLSFRLSDDFVSQYKTKQPKWGFQVGPGNTLGELNWLTKYSRRKLDGSKERYWEGCRRVIEGMYSIQKDHSRHHRTRWNEEQAQTSAQEAFDRLFSFKWTPPGRGLWMMGTFLVNALWDSGGLQNCAFISTKDVGKAASPGHIFGRLMEMSMLGVGVGFDTRGAGTIRLHQPRASKAPKVIVDDSREGWAESTELLLNTYFLPNQPEVHFDYSEIRPAGAPIKGFGGKAAGPKPLIDLHRRIRNLFNFRSGQPLTESDIVDVMNMEGKAVVAANVRSSAEIALSETGASEFLDLKNPFINPTRLGYMESPTGGPLADAKGKWIEVDEGGWGYTSNNSCLVRVGSDYTDLASRIAINGEPGLVWLDMIQEYGRLADQADGKDRRSMGTNPCGEQNLEPYECCVSGATRLQTLRGAAPIEALVGRPVKVWNGKAWAEVVPFETGTNRLYRVHLSDGSYLDATPGHEWVAGWQGYKPKVHKTVELKVGMHVPEFSLGQTEGAQCATAYQWGWVAGDGYLDGQRVMGLVQEAEASVLTELGGVRYPWQVQQFRDAAPTNFCRVNLSSEVPVGPARILRDHSAGLPEEIFGWDPLSIAEFMGGWIDTDGCLEKGNPKTDHYSLYGSESKLRDAQILLRRIGVNHASLRLFAEAGSETNVGVRNYALWRLTVPSYEASAIRTKLKQARRFGVRERTNNAHPNGGKIDAARKQRIVSIEELPGTHMTYCVHEPQEHMAVFGNVLTKQCTLVETFPMNCLSMQDYQRTLKFAYLYGKTVTLLPTHWPETNEVMMRNRRIGTSMTGIAQFVESRGWAELRKWQETGYAELRKLDVAYSEWLGVRRSIKLSTVKPSGTVALLGNSTPGVHWPTESGKYLRRMRLTVGDPVAQAMKEAGYPIEPNVQNPEFGLVVTCPTKGPDMQAERQVSVWQKVALAADCQRYWSDNAVSVTASFRPDEAPELLNVIRAFEGKVKTLSFLPLGEDMGETPYAQMPYERASEANWQAMWDGISPLDWDRLYAGEARDAEGERFCSNDTCEIKFDQASEPVDFRAGDPVFIATAAK